MLAYYHRDFEEDACPISDHELAKLYGANEHSLPGLVDAIEPDIKPALAFYCYRRAHLHTVGLAIAANCDESELVCVGGEAGAVLFARSREAWDFVEITPVHPSRRKITLARSPLWSLPLEEEDGDLLPSRQAC